jgi:SAM-dependent methyltransferase
MLTTNTDKNWARFGATDPYYAVATHERFHRDQLNEDTLREFFEIGLNHITEVFKLIHNHFVPGFRPARGLEFGCGVGRLVIPLAKLCVSVVGVDVSEAMLREAKNNCDERGIANVDFVKGDDELTGVRGSFDFINSHVVFQHIPTKRGEQILRELLARLQPGGIGVLHFAYAMDNPGSKRAIRWLRKSIPGVHGVLNLLQGKALNYPQMQGNCYDLNRVLRMLQTNGCGDPYVRFTHYAAYHGVILVFQKVTGSPHAESHDSQCAPQICREL